MWLSLTADFSQNATSALKRRILGGTWRYIGGTKKSKIVLRVIELLYN